MLGLRIVQVSKDECDYMLDLSFPHRPEASESWTTSASSAAVNKVESAVPEAVETAKSIFDGLRRRLGSSPPAQPVVESTPVASPKAGTDRAVKRVFCAPMLDNQSSSRLTRTLWMPFRDWQLGNRWGELCLLRRPRRRPREHVVVG